VFLLATCLDSSLAKCLLQIINIVSHSLLCNQSHDFNEKVIYYNHVLA